MTYPLDLLDPPGSGRVTPNPVPRAPEGTLRGDVASRNFWAAGPQGGGAPPAAPTAPAGPATPSAPAAQPTPGRALVPTDGARMVSGDRMAVPGTPYQPNFTIPQGAGPAPGAGPASTAGGLRDAAYAAGQKVSPTINAGKEWLFGAAREAAPVAAAEPAKTVLGRAGQAVSGFGSKVGAGLGQAAHVAGRIGGITATADSFGQNVEGMSNVFYSGGATLGDKVAAGVEGAGNIIGTGVMSLGSKLPIAGPLIAGAIGPNPASRLADITNDSVLDKFNPGKGFGTTRAEQRMGMTPSNAAAAPAPAAPAAPAQAQAQAQAQTPTATPAQPGFTERSPGIFQRGKNEFSDAAGLRDASFWARGEISPQNMRAANAMDARYRAQAQAGAAPGGAGGSQYQREVEDANARNAAASILSANNRSILPGGGILSAEFQQQSNRESASRRMAEQAERRPGETAAAHNARVGMSKAIMERDQRETESVRGDGTARRGQDLGYSSTTRGQDLNYGATLRGQDMDLQGRIVPKQMEIQMQMAQRQRLADLTNGSRAAGPDGKPGAVDYTAAQQRALMMGDATSAEALGKMVSNVQGQTAAAQGIDDGFQKKLASRVAIPLMKDGQPTGQRNEVEEAAMVSQMMQSHPELNQLSPAQLNEALPKLLAGQTLLQKYNKVGQDTGFGWRGEIIPSYNDQLPQLATEPAPGALSHLRPQREGFFNGIGADPNDVTLRGNAGSYNLGPLNALEAETLRGWTTPATKK